MNAEILEFKSPMPRLQRLGENLYLLKMVDTPEANAQAQKLIEELRRNEYVVPDYLKQGSEDYEAS